MKKVLPLTFLLVLSWGALVIAPATLADSLVADELNQVGIAYYEKGEYMKAVHEFSKAILVDPKNETAREYLQKMGIQDGLYGRQHPALEQVAQLGEQVVAYEKQVVLLEEENQRAADLVQQLQQEKDTVEKAIEEKTAEAEDIRQQAEEKSAQDAKLADELRAKAAFKEKEILRLHTDLYELKDRLSKAQGDMEATQEKWQEAQKRIRWHEQEFSKERMKYKQQQGALEREAEAARHNAEMVETQMQAKLDDTHEQLMEKTNEADAMKDQLIFANYKLANFERLVANREKNGFEQEQALAQMQAQVDFLKKKLQEHYEAKAAQMPLAKGQVPQNADFIKKQDKQIAELKTQLLTAREALQSLQAGSVVPQGEDTSALQQKLAEMSTELEQTKSLYENKDSEYQILEKRLKDLQERLGVVEEMLRSRDAQMKDLENQLDDNLLKMDEDKR